MTSVEIFFTVTLVTLQNILKDVDSLNKQFKTRLKLFFRLLLLQFEGLSSPVISNVSPEIQHNGLGDLFMEVSSQCKFVPGGFVPGRTGFIILQVRPTASSRIKNV